MSVRPSVWSREINWWKDFHYSWYRRLSLNYVGTVYIRELFKKYPTWFFFSPRKIMKHGRCAVVGRWRVPSCAYVQFFPASRQRQSRAASVWVRVYMQRASHCYFLWKWRNDSSSGFASNFARSLVIASGNHSEDSASFRRRCHGHHTN